MQVFIEDKKREQQVDYRIRKITNKLIRRSSKLADEVISDLLTINLDSENPERKSTTPATFLTSGNSKGDNIGVYISPKFNVSTILAQQQQAEKTSSETAFITPKIDLRRPQKQQPT